MLRSVSRSSRSRNKSESFPTLDPQRPDPKHEVCYFDPQLDPRPNPESKQKINPQRFDPKHEV